MKKSIVFMSGMFLFLVIASIFLVITSQANAEEFQTIKKGWKITWHPVEVSIVHKVYNISVQNLLDYERDIDITAFISDTKSNINEINNFMVYEWKNVSYVSNEPIKVCEQIDPGNGTVEVCHYIPNIVERTRLEWKPTKTASISKVGEKYDKLLSSIMIPKFDSKPKDGTYNGIKWFRVEFDTPANDIGKVGFRVEGEEFHPWYNVTFDYKWKFEINDSNTTHAMPLQVKLILNSSNIDYAHVGAGNGEDLRFVNSSENAEYDYWIETWNTGGNSIVWLDAPVVPGTYYMYYGNLSAVDAKSNCSKTMVFCDLFDRADSGTVGYGWIENAEQDGGALEISSERLKMTGGNSAGEPQILNNMSLAGGPGIVWDNIVYHFDIWKGSSAPILSYFSSAAIGGAGIWGQWAGDLGFDVHTGGAWIKQFDYVAATSYSMEYIYYTNFTSGYYLNGSRQSSCVPTANPVHGIEVVHHQSQGTPANIVYFDNIWIRNFATPDPAVSFKGSEEGQAAGGVVLDINLTSPLNISYINTTSFTINGSVNALSNITWSIDGGANRSSAYNATWFTNATTSTWGPHYVNVSAYEIINVSNKAQNGTYFTLNSTPATPSLTLPINLTKVWINWTILNYSTSDADGDTPIYTVWGRNLTGANKNWNVLYTGYNNYYNWSNLPLGRYAWQVHAGDSLSNSTNSSAREFWRNESQWMVDWSYRWKFNINRTNNTVHLPYQVRLIINDSNIEYDHAEPDGRDIRFAVNRTQEVNYWIEHWDTTGNSIIWLNATDIDGAYVMYYGNQSAVASKSNGTLVFPFFDDFNRTNTSSGTLGKGWLTTQAQIYDGRMVFLGASVAGQYAKHNTTILMDENFVTRYQIMKPDMDINFLYYLREANNAKVLTQYYLGQLQYHDGTQWVDVRHMDSGQWHWLSYLSYTNNTFAVYGEGNPFESNISFNLWGTFDSDTTITHGIDELFLAHASSQGATTWFDNIMTRWYSTPEPTFSFYGAEEEEFAGEAALTLTVISPLNITYINQTIQINGTTNKAANVTFHYNGSAEEYLCWGCVSFNNVSTAPWGINTIVITAKYVTNVSDIETYSAQFQIVTSAAVTITPNIVHEYVNPPYKEMFHVDIMCSRIGGTDDSMQDMRYGYVVPNGSREILGTLTTADTDWYCNEHYEVCEAKPYGYIYNWYMQNPIFWKWNNSVWQSDPQLWKDSITLWVSCRDTALNEYNTTKTINYTFEASCPTMSSLDAECFEALYMQDDGLHAAQEHGWSKGINLYPIRGKIFVNTEDFFLYPYDYYEYWEVDEWSEYITRYNHIYKKMWPEPVKTGQVIWEQTNYFQYPSIVDLADTHKKIYVTLMWLDGKIMALDYGGDWHKIGYYEVGETYTYKLDFDLEDDNKFDLYAYRWHDGQKELSFGKTGIKGRQRSDPPSGIEYFSMAMSSSLCNVDSDCLPSYVKYQNGSYYGTDDYKAGWQVGPTSRRDQAYVHGWRNCEYNTSAQFKYNAQWMRNIWEDFATGSSNIWGDEGWYIDNTTYTVGSCENVIMIDNIRTYSTWWGPPATPPATNQTIERTPYWLDKMGWNLNETGTEEHHFDWDKCEEAGLSHDGICVAYVSITGILTLIQEWVFGNFLAFLIVISLMMGFGAIYGVYGRRGEKVG